MQINNEFKIEKKKSLEIELNFAIKDLIARFVDTALAIFFSLYTVLPILVRNQDRRDLA